MVDFTRSCLAVEVLVAAQALEMRKPLRPGRGVAAAYACVRQAVPPMEEDREIHRDIEAVSALIDSGALLAAAHAA